LVVPGVLGGGLAGAIIGSAVGGFPGALVGGAIGAGIGGVAGFGAQSLSAQRIILVVPFRPMFPPIIAPYYFYY